MDTRALVVILVSGAVAGVALWIAAGWLREAARAQQRAARRAALAPRPARAAEAPAARPAAAAATAAAAAFALPPAPPVLDDELLPPSHAGADTAWPSTNFPSTQPQSMLPDDDPVRALSADFAETLPMELLSN